MLVSLPDPVGAGVPARDLWLGFGWAACMRLTLRDRSGIGAGAGELVRDAEVRLAKLELPASLLLDDELMLFR